MTQNEGAMQDVRETRRPPAPEMGPGPETHHTDVGDETVVNTVRARQAVTGHHVRVVLGLGLAAVIIAFAIAYFFTK